MVKYFAAFFLALLFACNGLRERTSDEFKVIAYYSAGPGQVDGLPAEKLSHIIFSFCHLQGNKLTVSNARDSLTIRKLVALKSVNPDLKIMLSLGGWGGCEPCSGVFSSEAARDEFSTSTLELNQYFGTDGLDLDWEYPAIEGFPGHPFKPEDKANFTFLIQSLRKTMGPNYELSFAAGGFQKFIDESVDWPAIVPLLDRVNVMTYDLVGGYATVTGHHTPLYSNPTQTESTDNAVQGLSRLGVPKNKIAIGGAFYARVWEQVADVNNGLYQSGKFKQAIDYKNFEKGFAGFELYWDELSQAPYRYHRANKLFATHDDERSLALKTRYAMDQGLNGIMFWELSLDKKKDGLLDAIIREKNNEQSR